MDSLRLVIYKRQSMFDDLIISSQFISNYAKSCVCNQIELRMSCNEKCFTLSTKRSHRILLNKNGINAYLASVYIYTMKRSDPYRKSAMKLLLQYLKVQAAELCSSEIIILIKLRNPRQLFLDYAWSAYKLLYIMIILLNFIKLYIKLFLHRNDRTTRMALERREIDNAMSWLSTLGGAFSALGEEFNYCVKN